MAVESKIETSYRLAREIYAELGVDTDAVLKTLAQIPISLHCWQGDDVAGFEHEGGGISGGGILATGNYPGRARNGNELRQDLEIALSLIPGQSRLNLHAMYAETNGRAVERDQITVAHFQQWIAWAKERQIGIDFNPSFFSHPRAASGFTLSSKDSAVRRFWIEHAKRCRAIGAAMGEALNTPCVHNLWIPDGSKDLPLDRLGHRQILKEALDEIFEQQYSQDYLLDSVESKLFGIGSEAFVVGSHEFYMGYALQNHIMLCLDMGHFHPTEGIADKISALLPFTKRLLIHVSRGVRWDSDHVTILNDDLMALAQEVLRSRALNNVYFALDFFDASINRITAWVTGARALQKALLLALLEPTELLLAEEQAGNNGNRLALLEECKTLPFGAVWQKYCLDQTATAGREWLDKIGDYEDQVLTNRF